MLVIIVTKLKGTLGYFYDNDVNVEAASISYTDCRYNVSNYFNVLF